MLEGWRCLASIHRAFERGPTGVGRTGDRTAAGTDKTGVGDGMGDGTDGDKRQKETRKVGHVSVLSPEDAR